MPVEDAKDLKQLSDESMALLRTSLERYQQLTLTAWERATGARKIVADEVAKDFTTYCGTVARDVQNTMMVWQQLVRVAAEKGDDKADDGSDASS